jgi:tetratricopeptide (TPR) repeat protein
MEPKNPYIAGPTVGNTPAFVGREDILWKVKSILRHDYHNAIVLYGQRRIGKTSVLQELETKLDRNIHYPVFFDLLHKAQQPLGQVLQELTNEISQVVQKKKTIFGTEPKSQFRQWLLNLLNELPTEKSLVLLFDEFDVLDDPKTEQASLEFFPYLNELLTINPKRLNFVFAIGRKIDDLTKISLSLFKGILTEHVSLLKYKDAIWLVRLSERNKTLYWSEESVETIWQQTNGHPYLTQALCYHVWEDIYQSNHHKFLPQVTLEQVEKAIPIVLTNSQSTFQWLWDGLGSAERIFTSVLAQAGKEIITENQLNELLKKSGVQLMIQSLQTTSRKLKDWDFIDPVEGGYRFCVELLRQWIVEYKPLSQVKYELDTSDQEAHRHFEAAEKNYAVKDIENALSQARHAININPNHIQANQLLAEILLAQNKTQDAYERLKKLYKIDPDKTRPLLIQALEALIKKTPYEDKQLELYEQILEIDPKHQKAKNGYQRIWLQRGDNFYENGDLENALKAYQKAENNNQIAKIKKNWQKQADELYHQGDLEKALELYQKLDLKEKIDKVEQQKQNYAQGIKKFEYAIKDIFENSKSSIDAIFLYDYKTQRMLYNSQNSATKGQYLLKMLLKQQPESDKENLQFDTIKTVVDAYGEKIQHGKLDKLILQFDNQSVILYFPEHFDDMAIGFVSAKGLGKLIQTSKKVLNKVQTSFLQLKKVIDKS